MKTQKVVRINYLRIYPRLVDAGEGKKPYAGALVLMNVDGGIDANALRLTAKQLDNLAGISGIRTAGQVGWNQLAALVGVAKSAAVVSIEPVKKGEKYIGSDGKEHIHEKKDWDRISVDSIMLDDAVSREFKKAVIQDVIDAWSAPALPEFEGSFVPESEMPQTK
jgi:hypothetical protein